MIANILQERMKIDIRACAEIEREREGGESAHVYKSQIYELLEDSEMEIIMPIEGGRVILLPLGLRYEFAFYTPTGMYKSEGQIKERYKTDNRYMLHIVLNTPLSKFQRREYYRMDCVMDMTYFVVDKERAQAEEPRLIMAEFSEAEIMEKQRSGTIVDISGGGIRFVSEEKNEAESYILILMKLKNDQMEKQYCLVGRILQSVRSRTAELRFENRVQFLIKDSKIREEIIRYIFLEERKARSYSKDR